MPLIPCFSIRTRKRTTIVARARRKDVRRYPSGQIHKGDRGETETQAMATVIAMRTRLGVPKGLERDQKAGTVLGRLTLRSAITREQYDAGQWYAETCAAFRGVMGIPSPTERSVSAEMVGGGLSCLPEEDEERSIAKRRRYSDVFAALRDLEIMGYESGAIRLLNEVCIRDQEIGEAQVGTLRSALNVVERVRTSPRPR